MKIGGNICRHNFLRSIGIAEDVRAKLKLDITLDQALLVLSDLNEWLHGDMFLYHGSTIAEFLNNLRWGIYIYLQPEFSRISRSIVMEGGDPPRYHYAFPDDIQSAFAKECYCNLMNEIRSEPCMMRFEVGDFLKQRF